MKRIQPLAAIILLTISLPPLPRSQFSYATLSDSSSFAADSHSIQLTGKPPQPDTFSQLFADSGKQNRFLVAKKDSDSAIWKLLWEIVVVVIGGVILLLIPFLVRLVVRRPRYRRYLKRIIAETETSPKNRELTLKPIANADSNTKNDNEDEGVLVISTHLLSKKRIEIFGKPGSGKTTALENLAYDSAKRRLKDKYSQVPILIKYNGYSNVFDQILHLLHTRDLVNKPDHMDSNRLKKQLARGKFLILIDDFHKAKANEGFRTEINRLFDFDRNRFVLMSRDYLTRSEFGFEAYRITPLSEEEATTILRLTLSEEETQEVIRTVWFDKQLRSLYSTPQMLVFLAQVYRQDGRIPLNKSKMFERFWILRCERENRWNGRERWKSLLRHLALTMLLNPEKFSGVLEIESIRVLNERVNELKDKGLNVKSAEEELLELLASGFLVRTDNGIEFEHDQWKEYFAAVEMFDSQKSIKDLNVTYPMREVLYFLTGMYSSDESSDAQRRRKLFLEELARLDFFLFGWCLENMNQDKHITIAEWAELHKDDHFSDTDISSAYEDYATSYRDLLTLHFSRLANRFYPDPTKEVGVVVGISELDSVHHFGLRQLKSSSDTRVEIIRQRKMEQALSQSRRFMGIDFFEQFGVRSLRFGSAEVLYSPPVVSAFHHVAHELDDIIRRRKLCESRDVQRERFYYETHALRRNLDIPENKRVLTFREVLDGFRKTRIVNSIRAKHVHDGVLDNKSLNEEAATLLRNGFDSPRGTGSTTFAGIYERWINDKDLEDALCEFIQDNQINPNESLTLPLPELPSDMRFQKEYLYKESEWEDAVDWCHGFYERFYINYKEMIELNFTTSKYSFPTYNMLPIHVVLVNDAKGRRGERFVLGGNNSQNEPIKVTMTTPGEFPRFKNNFHLYTLHHHFPFGLMSSHMFEREPLRKAVYDLIYTEYRELVR